MFESDSFFVVRIIQASRLGICARQIILQVLSRNSCCAMQHVKNHWNSQDRAAIICVFPKQFDILNLEFFPNFCHIARLNLVLIFYRFNTLNIFRFFFPNIINQCCVKNCQETQIKRLFM